MLLHAQNSHRPHPTQGSRCCQERGGQPLRHRGTGYVPASQSCGPPLGHAHVQPDVGRQQHQHSHHVAHASHAARRISSAHPFPASATRHRSSSADASSNAAIGSHTSSARQAQRQRPAPAGLVPQRDPRQPQPDPAARRGRPQAPKQRPGRQSQHDPPAVFPEVLRIAPAPASSRPPGGSSVRLQRDAVLVRRLLEDLAE